MNRFWKIAGVVGTSAFLVGAGVTRVASAAAVFEPTPAEVTKWCSAEQAGAHKLSDDLRRRERELAMKDEGMKAQSAEMVAAQARLDQRMAELTAMRAEITALLGQADAERAGRVAGLVKMVEANRAASVAPMFGQLEPDLAVEVLNKMNRKKAGVLLAVMPPAQAAMLAEQMTRPLTVKL